MARLSVNIRVVRELVIRESDGATLFLVAGYLGANTQPIYVAVIDPNAE
jgi:hypothetical protein